MQEAFAAGALQGLTRETEKVEGSGKVARVAELRAALGGLVLQAGWLERLDLVAGGGGGGDARDETAREERARSQAASAVLDGMARLRALGVATRRPPDYFAEMAKTDQHMQRVRADLSARGARAERQERARSLREGRKLARGLQAEARLERAAAQRDLKLKLQRARRGGGDLDFLEERPAARKRPANDRPAVSKKRAEKDRKFGFGGKKRGSKRNTSASSGRPDDGFNGAERKADRGARVRPRPVGNKLRPGKSKRRK